MQSTYPIRSGVTGTVGDLGRSETGKIFLAVGATVFVAMCAHISFPLYFTPVPVTLQSLAVILVGFILGPSLGFSALALYLAEGAMGLPVFSPHGPGGIAQLLGPTGGFLVSYPLAAALAGYIVRLSQNARLRIPIAVVAGCASTLLTLATGAIWLAHVLHIGLAAAAHLACLPFLPGECFKIAAASIAFGSLHRWGQA